MATYLEAKDWINRFIELANEIQNEGVPKEQVNGAMMFASGVYATYVASDSNVGFLHDSGVDKVVDVYRQNLAEVQALRRAEAKQAGHEVPEKQ